MTLSAHDVAKRFHEHCSSPDDFRSLEVVLADAGDDEELWDEVCDELPEKLNDWLYDEVDNASSSDQAFDAIQSVKEVADTFDLAISDLDLEDAEERADRIAHQEDAQAEMQEDDRAFHHHDERLESRAVDDILDSLK